MIVQLGKIGLTESPQFVASENAQAETQNAGNEALAKAVASAISSYGYNAWVEPSTEVWSWAGMIPPRTYVIRVEGLETSASVGGSDYLNRNARDIALSIIGNATGSYPQDQYPSTTVIGARQVAEQQNVVSTSRPTGTTTRPAPTAVARPAGVVRSDQAVPQSTAAILTGDTTTQVKLPDVLQQIIPTGDLSTWASENKWLLIGGAAVVAFFVMGRGK